MNDIPKKEIIDDIYKNDKPNQSNQIPAEEIKMNNIVDEDKKIENGNDNNEQDKSNELNNSKLNDSPRKRRQGMYIFPKKNEESKKEEKKDLNKENEEKEKEQSETKEINHLLKIILNFETSQIGIILIIIIAIIGLLFYDIKHAAIPGKFDFIYLI